MKKLLMLSFGLLLLCSLSAQTNLVKNPSFQFDANLPGTNSNILGTDQGYTQGTGDFSNIGMDLNDWVGRYDIKGVDDLGGKQYYVSPSGTDFECLDLEDNKDSRHVVVASGNTSDCNSSEIVNTTTGLLQSQLTEELENDESHLIKFRWQPNLVDEFPSFLNIGYVMTSHENKFRNNLSQQTLWFDFNFETLPIVQQATELGYMPWIYFNHKFTTDNGWFKNGVKYVNLLGLGGSYSIDDVAIYKCSEYIPNPHFTAISECVGGELDNLILEFVDFARVSQVTIDIREVFQDGTPVPNGLDFGFTHFPGLANNTSIDMKDIALDLGIPEIEWSTGARYRIDAFARNECELHEWTFRYFEEDCIVDPPSINLNTFVFPCEGDNQAPGFITATVSGGIAPYAYQINNGTPVMSNNTSHTFNNIYEGNYSIKVTDGQGLMDSDYVSVMCQFAPDPGTSDKNTKVAEDREGNSFDLNSTTKDGKSTLSCSPNPASDLITISYHLPKESNTKLLLVNAQGSIISTVQNFQYKAAGDHQVDLSIQSLTPGMYFLLLDAGENKPVTKFIKQ